MSERFTASQRAIITSYIGALQHQMGLDHWRVDVVWSEAPSIDSAIAQVHPYDGRWFARMWLCDGFLDDTAEEIREHLVHELIHLHLAMAQQTVEFDVAKLEAPRAADDVWFAGARRAIEYAVDGIARAWSRTLPLPPLEVS